MTLEIVKIKTIRKKEAKYWICIKVRFLILSFILLSSTNAYTEEQFGKDFVISDTYPSQKLSQKTILGVLQLSNNIIWIATVSGASKYDGHRLIEYTDWIDEHGKRHRLNISKILENESGHVLIATYGSGLLEFDPVNEEFQPAYTHLPVFRDKEFRNISYTFIDSERRIWLGTDTGRLVAFDANSFGRVVKEELSGRISDITESQDGSIFVASENGDLLILASGATSPNKLSIKNQCGISSANIEALQSITRNALLVGTRGEGLHELNLVDNECSQLQLPNSTANQAVVHEVTLGQEDSTIWAATDQGLYQISKNDVQHYTQSNSGLSNNEVTSLFLAPSGLFWIGTYNGLNVGSQALFDRFTTSEYPYLSSVVAIDGNEEIGTWIATYRGLYRESKGAVAHEPLIELYPNMDVELQSLMSILIDGSSIWVGTRNQGLYRISTQQGVIENFSQESNPALPSNSITTIIQLASGELIAGTYGAGLVVIKQKMKTYDMSVIDDDEGLQDTNVTAVYQASTGVVWVAHETGLQSLNLDTGEFRNIRLEKGGNQLSAAVLSITEDSAGNLWIGTLRNGIFVLESGPNYSPLTAHAFKSGTPVSSTIYALEPDQSGGVWASTSSGLTYISNERNVLNFRSRHGIQSTDFEFGASHSSFNGDIYFGGNEGYNRFNPAKISLDSKPPPVLLTGMNIAGNSKSLKTETSQVQSIHLNHTDYYITFEFSALDFIDPGNNLYRYKLEGFDPDWIDIGNRNTATYTNLPAGDYRFRVQAANASGIWNQDGIDIALRMNPAPWYTWWAYCLYALAAAMLFWHFKRIYDNYAIRNKALKLAEDMQITADRAMDDVQEQLDEQAQLIESIYFFNLERLELLCDCLARHADFLPASFDETSLTSTQGRLTAMLCLERSLLYKHEVLLCNLHTFINDLSNRLLADAEAGELITVLNEVPERLVPARQALPISLVLYELLDNAIRHAFPVNSQGAFILVSAKYGDSLAPAPESDLEFTIADNGVGLPPSLRLETPETEGLVSIVEVIESMGGSIAVDREQGTSVTFTVPSQCSD